MPTCIGGGGSSTTVRRGICATPTAQRQIKPAISEPTLFLLPTPLFFTTSTLDATASIDFLKRNSSSQAAGKLYART